MGVAADSGGQNMSGMILRSGASAPRSYRKGLLLSVAWAVGFAAFGVVAVSQGCGNPQRFWWTATAVTLWASLPMLVLFTDIVAGSIPGRASIAVAMLLYLSVFAATVGTSMIAVGILEPARVIRISRGAVKGVANNIRQGVFKAP